MTLYSLIFYGLFAAIPAFYINKYLVQLTRPKESRLRLLAYFIIILAAAMLYTAIFCFILMKFLYRQ